MENKVEQRKGKLLEKSPPFHFLTLLSCLFFRIKASVFNQLATSKQTRVFQNCCHTNEDAWLPHHIDETNSNLVTTGIACEPRRISEKRRPKLVCRFAGYHMRFKLPLKGPSVNSFQVDTSESVTTVLQSVYSTVGCNAIPTRSCHSKKKKQERSKSLSGACFLEIRR